MSLEQPSAPVEERKRGLRRRMRAMRLVADQKEGPDAALAVARLAVPRHDELGLAAGAVVAGYWPIATELDVRPLMARLEAIGIACALPAIEPGCDVLVFRRWRPGEGLIPGIFETMQPPASAAIVVPDALLVPLLAVDRAGRRLGHGRGWYDRTLAALRHAAGRPGVPAAVGVGFAAQVIGQVPVNGNDQPVDWILTGQTLMRCERRP
ncbi:MAG: 5-formyltetrahydrofolate cyclo-ligase [Rhodospirillales bacterium]|nr:5-formyltetrahydrofolate cyclo-ligase [Rhodospirillales bacterium]